MCSASQDKLLTLQALRLLLIDQGTLLANQVISIPSFLADGYVYAPPFKKFSSSPFHSVLFS